MTEQKLKDRSRKPLRMQYREIRGQKMERTARTQGKYKEV